MKENSEEDIKNIEEIIELSKKEIDAKDENITAILDIEDLISLEHILSDYKRVLEINEVLLKKNEELKKDYYNVINKIENKIDRFDYEFKKAKRQNNKDKADCYWNLIINFKELLESEE